MRLLLLALTLAAVPAARAVEITLVTTNIVVPQGRTFQMPVTASDVGGGVLHFGATSSNPKALTPTFAPATNRTLVLNVSGVDATNAPFTGDVYVQLFEDLTPRTTARIISLVNSNYYNGLTFYRVEQDFVCQAGPTNGESTASLDDEYSADLTYSGFGQLGLAKRSDFFGNLINDSGSSAFYITDGDLSVTDTNKPAPQSLNFRYPIFGQMTRGFDVLEKIMETPLDSGEPASPPVINSAILITNSQDAVLRLHTAPNFAGVVTVTITATNASQQVAQQTLTVNVVTNKPNSAAFLGPVPASLTVTQGQAATFLLTATDIDGDQLNLGLEDTDTGSFPSYLTPSIDSLGNLLLVPDLMVTGAVHLLVGVTDNLHAYDTQNFNLTIVPRSVTPTLQLLPKSGAITVATNGLGGKLKLAGTFTFTGATDHTFINEDIVQLTIGDETNPLMITLPPNLAGRFFKKGTLKFKTIVNTNTYVSAQFSATKGTFKVSISRFHFPGPQANPFQIGLMLGNDYGTDVRPWTETKPEVFSFPKGQ